MDGRRARRAHLHVPRRNVPCRRRRALGNTELATKIGRNALWAGGITGVASIAAAVTLELDAESLASGLHGRGLPLIIISAVAGSISMFHLWKAQWALARVGAVIAVAAVTAVPSLVWLYVLVDRKDWAQSPT